MIISIILARGGSKGVKNKNLVSVGGKPLLFWTINNLKLCNQIEHIFVSSDSQIILEQADKYEVNTIKRPDNISLDTSSSEEGWLHAIDVIEKKFKIYPSLVVAPQVTSPLRADDDFCNALNLFKENNLDSLLSVVELEDFFVWKRSNDSYISHNFDFTNRKRRQDIEKKYLENGSFYIFSPNNLKKYNNRLGGKIGVYIMNKMHKFQIDNEEDIEICDKILGLIN